MGPGGPQFAAAPYGGSRALLEAFLSTMQVLPASVVPFEERGMRVIVSAPAGENDGPGTACDDDDLGVLSSGLPGTRVTVTNEFGVILGVGHVPGQGTMYGLGHCVFEFPIELAQHADYYTLDIGERFGTITVSRSDVVDQGSEVRVNLSSQ